MSVLHGNRRTIGGDVDADPGMLPLFPRSQAPRCMIADTGASNHMASSQHTLYDFGTTASSVFCTANGGLMKVKRRGKLDFMFPSGDELLILTLDGAVLDQG